MCLVGLRHTAGSCQRNLSQPLEEWDQLPDDNVVTVAEIDRLVSHSTIIQCDGDRYRNKLLSLKQASQV